MATEKRQFVSIIIDAGLSILKACLVGSNARTTSSPSELDWHKLDAAAITTKAVFVKSPRTGSGKYFDRMRFKGFNYNFRSVYRVYRQTGVDLRPRYKRVLPKRIAQLSDVLDQSKHQ